MHHSPTHRARPRRRGDRGFTLIELLVVVSMIVLLIALLLPALKQTREIGRKTACASNLKQIGSAYAHYMSDHQNRFLRYPDDNVISAMVYGGRAGDWSGAYNSASGHGPGDRLLNRYVGVPRDLPPEMDDTFDVPLFRCPSDSGALAANPEWDHTYRDVGTSYAYNYWYNAGGLTFTLKDKGIHAATRPSFTILIGGHPIHNYTGGGDRLQRWHDPNQPTANILFIDQHVAYGPISPGHTGSWYSYLLDPTVP